MTTGAPPIGQVKGRGGPVAGIAIWFAGLSSAGKSTISQAVYAALSAKGWRVQLLDGDEVRQHLSSDLGYTRRDRDENVRRIGFVAELLVRHGVIVLVAAISPYRKAREDVRIRISAFLEVYVNAPLAVVEQRDRKGIYRRCRAGALHGVTGIDDPYEPPNAAEVECRTDVESVNQSVEKVLHAIEDRMEVR